MPHVIPALGFAYEAIASVVLLICAVTVVPVSFGLVTYEGFSLDHPFTKLMATQRGRAEANAAKILPQPVQVVVHDPLITPLPQMSSTALNWSMDLWEDPEFNTSYSISQLVAIKASNVSDLLDYFVTADTASKLNPLPNTTSSGWASGFDWCIPKYEHSPQHIATAFDLIKSILRFFAALMLCNNHVIIKAFICKTAVPLALATILVYLLFKKPINLNRLIFHLGGHRKPATAQDPDGSLPIEAKSLLGRANQKAKEELEAKRRREDDLAKAKITKEKEVENERLTKEKEIEKAKLAREQEAETKRQAAEDARTVADLTQKVSDLASRLGIRQWEKESHETKSVKELLEMLKSIEVRLLSRRERRRAKESQDLDGIMARAGVVGRRWREEEKRREEKREEERRAEENRTEEQRREYEKRREEEQQGEKRGEEEQQGEERKEGEKKGKKKRKGKGKKGKGKQKGEEQRLQHPRLIPTEDVMYIDPSKAYVIPPNENGIAFVPDG